MESPAELQPTRTPLLVGLIAAQICGLLTLLLFSAASYIAFTHAQSQKQPDWTNWAAASIPLLLGITAWLTLTWFLAVRMGDLIEWVLDRGGVLPVLDHNPAEYGIPMGLASYAELIGKRNHEVLLQGVLSTSWLIVHEFGQPLGLIKDQVGDAGALPAEEANERLLAAEKQVRKLRAYLRALKAFRDGTQPDETVEVGDLVREIVRAQQETDARRIDVLQLDVVPRYEVYALRPLLAAAIVNLLKNALKYTSGRIFITLEPWVADDRTDTPTENVAIRIEDEGDHLPEEKVANLFRSPVRETASEHGLGLPLSRVYCRLHGGDLQYDPKRQRKAFVIILPLA